MKTQDITGAHGAHAIFMVFTLRTEQNVEQKVKDLCSNVSAMVRSMHIRLPGCEASCVLGFGATAWARLFPDYARPKELEEFKEIRGEQHCAPSTPGDILLHIRANRMDACYELASIISQALEDAATSVDEVHGFRYLDGRAIIGFVDGTENPEGDDRQVFGCIGEEDADFTGGSYVFVQKYLHNMQQWNALPTEEQEKAIGRHKFNDVELTDEEKPANAHNAVTNITNTDGEELKIVRANMPFANPSRGEYGTYFIGYAGTFTTTRKMLENMFIGDPVGNTDRLLDFSTAVTGTLFFAPTADMLESLGE